MEESPEDKDIIIEALNWLKEELKNREIML